MNIFVVFLVSALVALTAAAPKACGGTFCLADKANCVKNKCVCVAPWDQRPAAWANFECYRPSQVSTEVKNDPLYKTFGDETFKLPSPCRYQMSQVKQVLRVKKEKKGTCEIQLHAFHKKHKGKFYVAGFDLALDVSYDDPAEDAALGFSVTLRKTGIANNGAYTYNEYSKNAFIPDGSGLDNVPADISKGEVEVKCEDDDANNRKTLLVKNCGLEIGFRAFDTNAALNSLYLPGLSVGINCANVPEFLNLNKGLSLAPLVVNGVETGALNVEETMAEEGFGKEFTAELFFLRRSIINGVPQTQPEANGQCAAAKKFMQKCDMEELLSVQNDCLWILKSPKFIRCADPSDNGSKITELFNQCVAAICDPSNMTKKDFCGTLDELVTVDGGVCQGQGLEADYPSIQDWLNVC